MSQVAALFVRSTSHYKSMAGVDAWDKKRDARKWKGGCPGVFHPPCRAWGQYKHLAKPRPDERQLAIWSLDMVRAFGGVIEHPKGSELWKEAGCLSPGVRDRFGGVLVFVNQSDFGHRALKPTGLYIVGPVPELPEPMQPGRVEVEHMGQAERETTPEPFAIWLVDLARSCVGWGRP